ncbi:MAG: hypothetical protein ABFC38_10550 [Methanospirillum sp.]
MPVESKLPIRVEYAEDFPTYTVDGVVGGLDPKNGRIVFFADEPQLIFNDDNEVVATKITRTYLLNLRMCPDTFCAIARWMNGHADYYENWCREQEENKTIQKELTPSGDEF